MKETLKMSYLDTNSSASKTVPTKLPRTMTKTETSTLPPKFQCPKSTKPWIPSNTPTKIFNSRAGPTLSPPPSPRLKSKPFPILTPSRKDLIPLSITLRGLTCSLSKKGKQLHLIGFRVNKQLLLVSSLLGPSLKL